MHSAEGISRLWRMENDRYNNYRAKSQRFVCPVHKNLTYSNCFWPRKHGLISKYLPSLVWRGMIWGFTSALPVASQTEYRRKKCWIWDPPNINSWSKILIKLPFNTSRTGTLQTTSSIPIINGNNGIRVEQHFPGRKRKYLLTAQAFAASFKMGCLI